jgi:diacylglycerol O-acyltransferase
MAENSAFPSSSSYRLSTQDATFIYGESQSGPLHIGSIGLFEGRVDFNGLLGHFEERMHLVPRYRQRLIEVPLNIANAMMEDDPEFAIENHVHLHELPDAMGEGDALGEMMRVYKSPLDRKHPLWALHVFHNLDGNRTALMWKVHHCLVYDFRAEPDDVPQPPEPWVAAKPSSLIRRMADALRSQIQGAVNATIDAAVEAIEDPASVAERARQLGEASRVMTELATRRIVQTPWNSTPVTQDRIVTWTRQTFSDFRAIRTAFGGSVNDVVLAMLTEGAARYLAHHGYAVEGQQLCIGCPVNVRHRDEKSSLGNRVSMMFPTAPASPMDIVERLKLIHEETERIKAAGSAQALETMMGLGDTIPPSLIGPASRAATTMLDVGARLAKWTDWKPRPDGFGLPAFGINFIATNVPGVQVPQYINGHVCLDMVPLVPLGATMGYAVAILSYYKSLYFGMMADPRVMPDVALMKAFVDDVFAELKRRCVQKSMEASSEEPERKSASGA